MTSRTTVKSVTFPRPFTLRGAEEELPAGTYDVETDEERIEHLSFDAYRRTAMWIHLPQRSGGNSAHVARIELDELDDALGAEAVASPASPDA